MKNMTREMYKELFNLTDSDAGMEVADEQVSTGLTYYEVAKSTIATMNFLLSDILNN